MGIALWGNFQQLKILDKSAMLVAPPDLRAMTWIENNTPEDARFLINSRLAYGGSTVVGGDGGWWIPLLAGRETIVPPMTHGTEKSPYLHLSENPRDIYFAMGVDDPYLSYDNLSQRMKKFGLDYIYIGQQRGRVWQDDGNPIDPDRIAESPVFETVYAEDGVRIFRVKETR